MQKSLAASYQSNQISSPTDILDAIKSGKQTTFLERSHQNADAVKSKEYKPKLN
ncbi:MAG: hypothetical protein KME46_14085 [Brasilonema angustatum HA4187-MV1]|nr:hypothetical protein [Brasilonema angustatum HA4187-MV1]